MKLLLTVTLLISLALGANASEHVLEFTGGDGPGKGKTIVLISGDEEYRSEESMPMLFVSGHLLNKGIIESSILGNGVVDA